MKKNDEYIYYFKFKKSNNKSVLLLSAYGNDDLERKLYKYYRKSLNDVEIVKVERWC